jgi:hypothetical protein
MEDNFVIAELQRRIKICGSQKVAAEELEISAQHLGDILRGRRTPGSALLEKLGFVKISVQVPSGMAVRVASAITLAITQQDQLDNLLKEIKRGKK